MQVVLRVVVAWLVILWPLGATAAEYREGAPKPPNVSMQAIGGDDGAAMRPFKTDPSGILRVREEYPPSASAIVSVNMVNAASVAATATITDFGTPWGGAGNHYIEGFQVSVDLTTGSPRGFRLYAKASHDGTNFDFVTYQRLAADTVYTDTLQWRFRDDTPSLGLGRGQWCAVPVEAQAMLNTAQHIKLAYSYGGTANATVYADYRGKR